MAFTKVRDVDLEILSHIETNFELVISLSILDKSNCQFMKTTEIYRELIIFKKNFQIKTITFDFRIKSIKKKFSGPFSLNMFNNDFIIKKACKLNLFKLFQVVSLTHLILPPHPFIKTKWLRREPKFYFMNVVLDAAVVYSVKYNRTQYLKFLKNNVSDFKIPFDAINTACKYGRIDILNWFQKNKIFEITKNAVFFASLMGHTNVLDWLDKNNYIGLDNPWYEQNSHILILDSETEIESSKKARINIIDYPNEYYEKSIALASFNGHVNILEWFKKSKYPFKGKDISIYVTNAAFKNGHINVIEWFKRQGHNVVYNKYAINNACKNGHVHVLMWFINRRLEFRYCSDAIYNACENNHLNILKYFWKNNIPFKYHSETIRTILINKHFHILEWITKKSSNLNHIVPKLKHDFE